MTDHSLSNLLIPMVFNFNKTRYGRVALIYKCFVAAHHEHSVVAKAAQEVVQQAVAGGPEEAEHVHGGAGMEMHSWIGAALVIGFVFMLLVDQLGGGHHPSVNGRFSSISSLIGCRRRR